ncbi:MAG: S8 family serine peptidase [Candidatus Thiodiazotropha sp. (ex Monitilora ramsayi)]|nr:S8 family serine peptidase [Candidatus Thiodiazotropha sp. (ex Monitilora ramsayi)]
MSSKLVMKTLWPMILFLAGCSMTPARMPADPAMMADMRNPADSRISEQSGARMFIATMTDASHRELTGGRPINAMNMQGSVAAPAGYRKFIDEIQQQYGIRQVADWPLTSIGVRCLVFEVSDTQDRESVIREVAKHARIETVQPMRHFGTLGKTYNDPYFELQHSYQKMSVASSHRWATGKGVQVAIIDTGVDVSHEDLKGQFSGHMNFVDSNEEDFSRDVHGTAIAGVIAATTGNGKGMTGIAPDARLWSIKACWSARPGDLSAQCSTFTLAKAINFAVTGEVDIINLSLAGPGDALLERLLQQAIKRDITVVAAVGSDPGHSFPASVKGVIAVDQSESKNNEKEHVQIMGSNILSTRPGNQYDFFSGSSFSTAQVSGLAALIRERKPHLSADTMKALLAPDSTRYRGTVTDKSQSVNACRLLARLAGSQCGDGD